MRIQAEIVFALALIVAAGNASSEDHTAALEAVKLQVPGVTWESVVEAADFDCDGKRDHAFLGKKGVKVIVAFRLSSKSRVQSFDFGVADQSEASICEEPAEIATESLEYDPSEAVDGVEGFRVSQTCKGLQLIGGECDFFHFYWNHVKLRIEWWRL